MKVEGAYLHFGCSLTFLLNVCQKLAALEHFYLSSVHLDLMVNCVVPSLRDYAEYSGVFSSVLFCFFGVVLVICVA